MQRKKKTVIDTPYDAFPYRLLYKRYEGDWRDRDLTLPAVWGEEFHQTLASLEESVKRWSETGVQIRTYTVLYTPTGY